VFYTAGKVRRAINNSTRARARLARISKTRARSTTDVSMSRSRSVTAGIFLPAVLDPPGIYRVARNYSGIGQRLHLEFVDRYSAPLFRHCFASGILRGRGSRKSRSGRLSATGITGINSARLSFTCQFPRPSRPFPSRTCTHMRAIAID
jgi:hypothetical protein